MKNVELIYDNDCPNVEQTRAQLLRAFMEAGLPAEWVEWERGHPFSPSYTQSYGSPTILVDGKDVADAEPAENISCCRLYVDANGGYNGAPSVEMIVTALRNQSEDLMSGRGGNKSIRWRSMVAVLPGVGVSMLPQLACPACWPVYAGLLGSFGLGFLMNSAYLFPITIAFLLIAVTSLGYKSRLRRGYAPFALGITASAILLVGKFHFGIDMVMYGGIGGLIAASLWNTWPRKSLIGNNIACPACESVEEASQPTEIE